MDLIIGQKDVLQTAMHDWSSKVAPAVLAHGQTLTGKASTLLKKLEMEYRGEIMISIVMMMICFLGDAEREYKVSLGLLCCLLPKKGVTSALSFIYEERKVHVAMNHAMLITF